MEKKKVSSAVKQSVSLVEMARPLMEELNETIGCLFDRIEMRQFRKILCTGCGDSYIAGAAAKQVFDLYTDLEVEVLAAEDVCYHYYDLAMAPGETLCIGISISGRVASTVSAMEAARARGAFTVGLTENLESPLAKHVQYVLKHNSPERDLAPGVATYFTSTMALMLLALKWGEYTGKLETKQAEELREEMVLHCEKYSPYIERLTTQTEELSNIFVNCHRFECIGADLDYATAWFAHAKIYESIGRPGIFHNPIDWMRLDRYAEGKKETGIIVCLSKGNQVQDSYEPAMKVMDGAGYPIIVVTDLEPEFFPESCHVITVPTPEYSWMGALIQFMPVTLLCGYMQSILGEVTFRGITLGIWGEDSRNRIYADVSNQIEYMMQHIAAQQEADQCSVKKS